MPITKLTIENFKGVDKRQDFAIKPITLFVGPNSSGKSSCLHALACLAQTTKIPNNTEPIVLDDDSAQVHLGRFIEVIHSKSYQDEITLGMQVAPAPQVASRFRKLIGTQSIYAEWSFKCALRTQDIRLERGELSIGPRTFSYKRISKLRGEITDSRTQRKYPANVTNSFFFTPSLPGSGLSQTQFHQYVSVFQPIEAANAVLQEELKNTLYLGPFRQPPMRRYPTRGSSPAEVGAQGEATVTLLANESIRTQGRSHAKQISGWLGVLGLAKSVEVKRIGKSDLFDLNVTLQDENELPIADLGYGVSQALPVLAQCSFGGRGATYLFEQPELHLHAQAARKLAQVFVDTTKNKGSVIIAETHSRDLFYEVIRLVNQGHLTSDDVVLYDVIRDEGASKFKMIKLEDVDGKFEVDHPWGKELDAPEV